MLGSSRSRTSMSRNWPRATWSFPTSSKPRPRLADLQLFARPHLADHYLLARPRLAYLQVLVRPRLAGFQVLVRPRLAGFQVLVRSPSGTGWLPGRTSP